MKVLVACEFSGVVRDAFTVRGHDAWSCDLLPSERNGQHIQGDVLEHLDDGWDLMIAHPPCTYLTNAGVRHLHSVPSKHGVIAKIHGPVRWEAMRQAAKFFKALLDAPIPHKCIENPVPHSYATAIIGRYSQTFQPWKFGHPESKRICLWLRGLPPLLHTHDSKARMQALPKHLSHRMHFAAPSVERWKIRSITYQGLADAMADQWGGDHSDPAPEGTEHFHEEPVDYKTV